MYDLEIRKMVTNLEMEQEPMTVEYKALEKKRHEMKEELKCEIETITTYLKKQQENALTYKNELQTIQSVYHKIMMSINKSEIRNPKMQ